VTIFPSSEAVDSLENSPIVLENNLLDEKLLSQTVFLSEFKRYYNNVKIFEIQLLLKGKNN